MLAALFDSIPAMIVLTGVLVGAAAALPGVFLVLRGNAMLTDAISHSIVFGVIMVWLLTRELSGPVQLIGAGLTGVLTVALTEALTRTGLVKTDAAIGLVFSMLFATGILLIGIFARQVHLHADTILLGEIGFVWMRTTPVLGVAVPVSMVMLGVVLVLNLVFVVLFWKELKLATFDPALAAALGLAPAALHYTLLTLTSVTAVAAFDAVGPVLFIAFVIVPPATALLMTRRLALIVPLAAALSTIACVSGYFLAVHWNVAIGGMMATMTGVLFVMVLSMRALKRQLQHRRPVPGNPAPWP
ncbi:MAG: metal ABC transporter permease [Rhodospirillales bacterium]|nr:MAG: metal ABC transporter permease [Rhodospirillales bacterium]